MTGSEGPLVAVVVLNYNNAADTVACLASLLELSGPGRAVPVVVDNASTDDSVRVMRAWAAGRGVSWLDASARPDVTGLGIVFVQADCNRGYAAGNNCGLQAARAWADYYWILNNDTVVEPESLRALLASPAAEIGLLGSTIVDFAGTRVQSAGGGWCSLWTTRTHAALEGISLREVRAGRVRLPRPLGFVSGCALFMSRKTLDRVGLLDESFFLYFEETDLARRAAALGVYAQWAPESIVFHKGGASTGARSAQNAHKSEFAEYHSSLSALYFTRKHLGVLAVIPAVIRLVLKSVFLVSRNEFGLFKPLLTAYHDFFRKGTTRGA